MRAADTNIVVRYVVQDHPQQFAAACIALEERDAWIGVTVVLETEWILRSVYNFRPSDVAATLRSVFGLPGVQLEAAQDVAIALNWYEQGMDFADAIHLARSTHCDGMATFDRDFIKTASRLGAGNVAEP